MKHAFSNPHEYKENSNLQYDFAHMLLKNVNLKSTTESSILDVGTERLLLNEHFR